MYLPNIHPSLGNIFLFKSIYEVCYDLIDSFQCGVCLQIFCCYEIRINSMLVLNQTVFECVTKLFIPVIICKYCMPWIYIYPFLVFYIFYCRCLFIIILYYFGPPIHGTGSIKVKYFSIIGLYRPSLLILYGPIRYNDNM